MTDIQLTTYDWVPEKPRGHVRDIRIRWALEEAGLAYAIKTVPFGDRTPGHLAHQPFGQVPWIEDGDLSVFESGAILLHLGEKSEHLLPKDEKARSEVIQWVFAALNSVEMASLPWTIFSFTGLNTDNPGWSRIDQFLNSRLGHVEAVVAHREWLAGRFSIADILMADVLRLVDRLDGLAFYPACRAYVQRATERPAFRKALADQLAHFAEADRQKLAPGAS